MQFGRPIAGFQLTQQKLADMALEYTKGVLLALHLGRRKDAGTLRPEQVSLGKLNNVREALEICRTARTILGANGISLEYPVIRHMNNLESVLTYEGTVEMHTLVARPGDDGAGRLPLTASMQPSARETSRGVLTRRVRFGVRKPLNARPHARPDDPSLSSSVEVQRRRITPKNGRMWTVVDSFAPAAEAWGSRGRRFKSCQPDRSGP